MKRLRHIFIQGLLALLPIATTLYILYFFYALLDNFLGGLIRRVFRVTLPGVGMVSSILLILLTGILVTDVLGARLFRFGEKMLQRIPVVQRIYFGSKQIIDAFSLQGKQIFSKVALVEYPRKGIYVVGFVTGACKGEVQEKTSANLINVFVPTTPNPTSGMLVLVPEKDVIYLEMTVEEGLKLIVSAGVVTPQ
ncbi:DUF502 domain-containing protein [Anaerotalea alkaliphila]|uniref:DUF502 domain-containing protein n=1 Tax=Anaerotalea alkaliphila TaxID=2662126 RepID=A0A7X5HXG1_9FIRM|nr:DUF502 domain-containing protein [Anaerotalea alkaliphila]NDL68450.1 DUF502 domain-containing protein [Anaerotalea alkaliphila]